MMSAATARNLRISVEDDVLGGLYAAKKRLPRRLLFDAMGLELYGRVTALDSYYPARVEAALARRHLAQIAQQVGPNARVIELGCGDPHFTVALLRALVRPNSYVPVELAGDRLREVARRVHAATPELEVQPVLADHTEAFAVPPPQHAFAKTLVVAFGGLVDTLEPGEARAVLARVARLVGPDRLLLVGADGTRDPEALAFAYDDAAIAAFEKNVLTHLNRTRGATFDLDAFAHRAVWNPDASRMEMHLVSARPQRVRVGPATISFSAGESIVIEHCYKHTPAAMQALLAAGGWRTRQVFTSSELPYRLWLCESSGDAQDRLVAARGGSR